MATPFAHLDPGGLSDVGRRRQENEDAIVLLPEAGIFCVSDGLGGHVGGEIASQAVVDGLRRELPAFAAEPAFEARCVRIRESLQKTNAWVLDQATRQNAKGMGATVVVLAFDPECPGQALILHAGDSRGYRFRNGQLTPLTMDHNMGNLLGEKKDEISAKLAGTLTHAVGIAEKLELSAMKVTVEGNNLFLLCSDGLYKMLPDSQIATLLQAAESLPAAQLAQQLVEAANEAGGRDNVSVIVIKAAVFPGSVKSAAPEFEKRQVAPVATNAVMPIPVPESSPAKANTQATLSRGLNARIFAIAGLGILVLAMFCGWLLQRQAAAKQNRNSYDTEMAEAKNAFNKREYEQARTKIQSAVKRFAEDSEEGMNAGDLQRKITSAIFERTEKFNAAIAEARAPQTKSARALELATLARVLFPEGSPERKQAQDLIDKLKDLGEKAAAKKAEEEKAKLLAELAVAELAAKKAEEEKAKLFAELAAKKAEEEKAKLLAEQMAQKAEAEKAKLLAEQTALAKKALEQQQTAAATQKTFNALLEAARTALANKNLDAAQQFAKLALPMFPENSLEWAQAQSLINEIAKAKLAVSTTPAVAVNPPVNPPVTTPTTPAGMPPAAPFGLMGLLKGKAEGPDLTNKTCYLRVNLWDDPARITTFNVHNGVKIPAGTPVSAIQVSKSQISFSINGKKLVIVPSGYVKGEDLVALQHRYFSEDNPKINPNYQQFLPLEMEAIENGKIGVGMGKEAVLMAYGYPAKTANLEDNAWLYWNISKASRPIEVSFVNGRVSAIKDLTPLPRSLGTSAN